MKTEDEINKSSEEFISTNGKEGYRYGYKQAIRDIILVDIDINKLEEIACQSCGVGLDSLKKKKLGDGIYPRYLIFNHLRRIKSLPNKMKSMAKRYGLERTTVYHNLRRVDALIQSNDFLFNGYLREFNNLIAKL